ncbi:MAG: 50S ribosomal protein L1 [Gammaproteobacteria bacterium]
MPKIAKRMVGINEQVTPGKFYLCDEALVLLKTVSKVKFNETVDACVILGIDARKSDQLVRGATVLPHGTGRSVRVAVIAQGANADAAKAAGAEVVGFENLAEEIKGGKIDFDILIATPDAMKLVGQLGQVLGPKGLMPNPKVGTVTDDVTTAVKNAKAGQARFRTDKNGIVHCAIGKLSFEPNQLKQNLQALMADLKKAKPQGVKGIYIRKVVLSTTMGPGLTIEQSSIGDL